MIVLVVVVDDRRTDQEHGSMEYHPLASRPHTARRLTLAVVGVGTSLLSACSSSTTSSSSPAAAAKPVAQGRPLASGSISSVGSSSMVIQNARNGGTVTVDWTSSTAFTQTVTADASDLAVGDCAQVVGATGSSGPAAARTVSITTATSSGCTRPGGLGGRGSGGGGGGGGFGGGALPFTVAFGSVTSVGNGSLTVKAPSTSGSITTTFTYDATTAFTMARSAHASTLASGQCATAFGSSTSSGAVAATSITLRPAGPNGCSAFGGGRGFGGASGFGDGSSQA